MYQWVLIRNGLEWVQCNGEFLCFIMSLQEKIGTTESKTDFTDIVFSLFYIIIMNVYIFKYVMHPEQKLHILELLARLPHFV